MRFKRDIEVEDGSREGRLARQLVIAKQEADGYEQELESLPRWRRGRTELKQRLADARERERELLEGLGAKPRA
jgi:hypothetical protein